MVTVMSMIMTKCKFTVIVNSLMVAGCNDIVIVLLFDHDKKYSYRYDYQLL